MQYVARYDVEAGRSEEFRTWLTENEKAIKSTARPGWTYLGTWFTVMGFGQFQAETRWEVDDYGDLGSPWNDEGEAILRAWFSFIDSGRPVETSLLKSAADVVVVEGT